MTEGCFSFVSKGGWSVGSEDIAGKRGVGEL